MPLSDLDRGDRGAGVVASSPRSRAGCSDHGQALKGLAVIPVTRSPDSSRHAGRGRRGPAVMLAILAWNRVVAGRRREPGRLALPEGLGRRVAAGVRQQPSLGNMKAGYKRRQRRRPPPKPRMMDPSSGLGHAAIGGRTGPPHWQASIEKLPCACGLCQPGAGGAETPRRTGSRLRRTARLGKFPSKAGGCSRSPAGRPGHGIW